VFYEYAPSDSNSLLVQKVRRGQGLIRVFWAFKGCIFKKQYGKYGSLILPVEFLMHCLFPSLFMAFLAFFLIILFFFNPLLIFIPLSLAVITFVLYKTANVSGRLVKVKSFFTLFASFFNSQLLLLYALLLWVSGRSLHKWKKVASVRNKEKWVSGNATLL
jgi:hypothetical protein